MPWLPRPRQSIFALPRAPFVRRLGGRLRSQELVLHRGPVLYVYRLHLAEKRGEGLTTGEEGCDRYSSSSSLSG